MHSDSDYAGVVEAGEFPDFVVYLAGESGEDRKFLRRFGLLEAFGMEGGAGSSLAGD